MSITKLNYKTIDSTNTEAKRLFSKLAPENYYTLNNTVLIAENQTAGKGRLGRSFYSSEKNGIYLSYIKTGKNIINPASITATTAIAVCNSIKNTLDLSTQIKWVNDIFFNEKKIAGILTEGILNYKTQQIEAVIIGVGINVFDNQDFPEQLKDFAGSLIYNNASNKEQIISSITDELIKQIDTLVYPDANIIEKQVLNEYREKSFLTGKTIMFSPVIDKNENDFPAKVIDINEDATLLIEKTNGERISVSSGEVTLISKNFHVTI